MGEGIPHAKLPGHPHRIPNGKSSVPAEDVLRGKEERNREREREEERERRRRRERKTEGEGERRDIKEDWMGGT